MKSTRPGKSTSKIEVSNISEHGIWLYAKGREYFLPYSDFPWFKDARVSEIYDVKLVHGHHLYWDSLDVDLELDSIEHLDRYPLKYKAA